MPNSPTNPNNSPADSFVAHLRVEKVTRPSSQAPILTNQSQKKQSTDVTSLTIKASTFENLKRKLAGHIELIDEDD